MNLGWWKIEFSIEPNEADLEQIAKLIKQGYTDGQFSQENKKEV